ncbi:response regulator transcription factor [Salinibacter grassmerensis]|uniref:response regulator transcription factor n=1 Tax=Salinibacter grassmerensis TaxID=3040353 RepID=UPI0021E6F8AB|nr:response regulator transcription factor [Salinibacter grassmerensis]
MSDQSTNHIRTFLVDDHPAILEAIRNRIDDTLDVEVCGMATSSDEAFRKIEDMAPDTAVVDISLEDAHGLDLVQNLQSQCPEVQVVVYSMYDEMVYAERAIQAGASGYLMKDQPTEDLIEAIRVVNEGEVFLSREMASQILNKVARGESSEPSFPIEEFTDRELAVFQMLGEGCSIEEIQDRLNLARKTVETYRRRAKEKLGFDSVSKLLQFAVQWASAPGAGKKVSGMPDGDEDTSADEETSGEDAEKKTDQ